MQEVNFYNALSKPGRYAINAKRARIIIILLIIFLAIIFALQSFNMAFQRGQLAYYLHEEKSTTQQLETLIQNSPRAMKMSKLEKTMRAYSEKINYQSTFSQEIAIYNAQNTAFTPSHYLHQLANATMKHIWLNKINIQNGGQEISLEGFTYNASLLVQYVATLQNEVDFKSKPFNRVTVIHTGNDKEKLPFVISTKADQKT
ncbi:MAG: PilN domain-containing protein [Gammaproteobacteria bacterium]|nr:PilN domain-containing protein [Gammaproteobacteria bacterium]